MAVIFETVFWKNFLSTGSSGNTVDLNGAPTTLIVGKNGEGKSTILDALCFGLFNKPFRNVNKPQLINSINGKQCLVEVVFSIGQKRYRVLRGMKPGIFEIYCNDELINQDSAIKDYQKLLEQQILKFNYRTFTQVVILGSASFVPFMQLPSHARREVIEEILDIKVFSTMNIILKEKIQETKETLTRIDNSVSLAKERVANQQRVIKILKETKKENTESVQQKIAANQAEIDEQTKKLNKLSSSVEKLKSSISNKSVVKEELEKVKTNKVKVLSKIENISTTLDFFKKNDVCYSCSQTITAEYKETKVNQLNAETQKYSEEKEQLEDALSDIKKRIDDMVSVQDKITEKTLEISGINSTITSLAKSNAQLAKELESDVSDALEDEKEKLKVMAQEAMDLIQKKNELSEKRKVQDIAYALLKDTGIKTTIIKEYLPLMNKLINKYLSVMDFFVKFELDETFSEVIKSRHRDEFTYSSFSEGEKQKIDLALLFTWRQIARMKNSINTNILLMDEVLDGSLDNNGTDYVMNLLGKMGENVNVIVISHNVDQLYDKFHRVIRFTKKNDFSVITT